MTQGAGVLTGVLSMFWLLTLIVAAVASPATTPGVGKLPHITVDAAHRQLRIECASVRADMPLEFLCCMRDTHEYESILRTDAKPSDVHLALLMIGLTPGAPAHRSDDLEKWYPPHGPPLNIEVEFKQADGQVVRTPAWRLMRDITTKKEPAPITWIFAGSHILEDGRYAADLNGGIVTLVNVTSALIDVPYVASRSIQERQWEYNPQTLPPPGTPVTLIITPAPQAATRPAGAPATRP